MSEGKKVLVVVEDLDRVILQEQLIAMGLDIDVVVDRETAGSIVTGLTALPTMRDEMMRIIGKRDYGSDFRSDAGALADRVAKEFNDFCLHYNFKALRDSVIGKINYGLAQGPDSGGNPAVTESLQEASATIKTPDNIIPTILGEVLKELKGIKEAVTSPTVLKIDMGTKPPMEMSPELRELLCGSQRTVSDLVEGLRSYTTAIAGEKFSSSRVVHWPSNKAEFVDLVTKAINATNEGNQELPAISLAQLTDNVRMDIIKLLNPSFSVSLHGHYNANIEPFDTGAIFAALLKGLDDGSGIVNFYGLDTLSVRDKGTLRYALQRALGKHRVKVVGGNKQLFLEGLVNALEETNTLGSYVEIEGIGLLSVEDSVDLVALLKEGLSKGGELARGGHVTGHGILETLFEALGSNEINTVKLQDLCVMDSRAKRNLHTSLKVALTKYDELQTRDKKLFVAGAEDLPNEVTNNNTAYTLGILTNLWAQAASEKGIQLDQMSLLDHLLKQVGGAFEVRLGDDPASMVFKHDKQGATNLTNITGVSIIIGNHTFDRNKDGSLKIRTDVNGKSSFAILNTDGGVSLHGPGYMG